MFGEFVFHSRLYKTNTLYHSHVHRKGLQANNMHVVLQNKVRSFILSVFNDVGTTLLTRMPKKPDHNSLVWLQLNSISLLRTDLVAFILKNKTKHKHMYIHAQLMPLNQFNTCQHAPAHWISLR